MSINIKRYFKKEGVNYAKEKKEKKVR